MLKLSDCTLKSFVVLVHHKPIVRSNFFFNATNKNFLPNLYLLAHFDVALTVFHLLSLLEPWQQWP